MFTLKNEQYNINETFDTQEQAYKRISEFLKSIGFKSYYYRSAFLEDDRIMVDYGSHTNFFYISVQEGDTNGNVCGNA